MTLALCATLSRHTVDNVTFTTLEANEPKNVVFLAAGEGTDDEWWFSDTTVFSGYENTLFIGVAQTATFKEDLGVIINWVNTHYSLPMRTQWSFCGFSLGAYETFSVALDYYYGFFGNYAAIGGGTSTRLVVNPNINFMYVCYGEHDIDKSSAIYAVKKLRANGFINARNYKGEVFKNEGHTVSEARKGLANFLEYISNTEEAVTLLSVINNFIKNYR